MKKQHNPVIMLIGPPNVGKSVLFNHLTGMNVSCANYAGTTVEFAAGKAVIGDMESFIIDVPGTYTLEATNEAEEVAVAMLSGKSSAIPDRGRGRGHCSPGCPLHQPDGRLQPPAAVLCVLDASHLESSLYLLSQLLKGAPQQMLMEIPELLTPRADVVAKKVWMRLKLYVTDGALPMVGAVALAAFLYESGVMVYLGKILSPLVTGWLHLPPEAAVPLVLGILRRELAVLPLVEMDLTALQLFVGAAVGLFYVPCIAIVSTMAREFRLPTALLVLLVTTTVAFLVGGILSRLGAFIL